jgi:anti-anti-sigma regulatory factor
MRAQDQLIYVPVFHFSQIENVMICELPYELTVLNRLGFRNPVYNEVPTKHLIVDFRHCRNIDTSALGAMVAVRKFLRERGMKMILTDLDHPAVKESFRLCQLDTLFTIDTTLVGALERFAPPALVGA